MRTAYYDDSIQVFIDKDSRQILGTLTESHSFDLNGLQRDAWLTQIEILKAILVEDFQNGWIAFEFSIPRMGRRVDTILLIDGIIFVLEFKVGSGKYLRSDIEQAEDYALDLKNFHAGSSEVFIVPILVATEAHLLPLNLQWSKDKVCEPVLSNGSNLLEILRNVRTRLGAQNPISYRTWADSGYRPTPTIIEAAIALYQGHKVEEISRSDADTINLSVTSDSLSEIISKAKNDNQKIICFVTGVPGAGKTLAGLNLATTWVNQNPQEGAVFLSGNGPLVQVLRKALAQDRFERLKESGQPERMSECKRNVETFIQNIHHFRDETQENSNPPSERIAIFDEAQRAWDAPSLSKFMSTKKGVTNFHLSEPEYLIGVMNRHVGWCAIVCLVGGGQEINSGEAGLTEWILALKQSFHDWKLYVSPQLDHKDYHWNADLKGKIAQTNHEIIPNLHLAVSIRSFRAEALSELVSELIDGNLVRSKSLYQSIKSSYPIFVTRDLDSARSWLRTQARGSERFGLVSSSGANRLKAIGLNVKAKISPEEWFLNDKNDVRSSFSMEDLATEFDIQGLELDWVGVCWDANFRYTDGRWTHYNFRGTRWESVHNNFQKAYLANAYRVLLTRARQGMVIFVPEGNSEDLTRDSKFYDGTFDFLSQIFLN